MKQYRVVVHYEGGWDFDIEAKNEDEAKDKAMELFGDLDCRSLINHLADVFVCDCWEE